MGPNRRISLPADPDGGVLHALLIVVVDALNRVPQAALLAGGYVFVALLGVVDYYTPSDLSFLIFYLVPVFVVTFFVGTWAGVVLSVASTAVWFGANTRELMADAATVVPFWNIAQKLAFFFLMTGMLAALKKAFLHEQVMARIDPLTGLPNRRTFREASEAEILRARRYKRPFSFAYVDLDGFKGVNDARGHAEGDRLLCAVADTLRATLREVDLAARMGGDEFAVLLPETGYEAARVAVDNLRERLLGAMRERGWPVTFTFGVVTYTSAVHSFDEMIGYGDQLMYKGKQAGRNGTVHRQVDEAPAA